MNFNWNIRLGRISITFGILIFLFATLSAQADQDRDAIRIPLQAANIFFDPSGVQDTQSLLVSRQINCQLVRNQGYFSELEAAESIKYTSPKEIVFKISSKAKFHDGSQVTANDVLASFNYIRKSRHVFQNLFSWVDKIKIYNDKTIILCLKKESPQFLKVLSSTNFPIFKKEFLERAEKNPALWKMPLGCGGYKVSEFTDNSIKLQPINQGLPIIFDLNKTNQLNASDMKNYDIVSINVIGNSKELNNFNILNIYDPMQYYLALNSKSKFWKNKYERCKFLHDIDIKKLLVSYGEPAIEAIDFFPKGTLGYSSKGDFNSVISALSKKSKNYTELTQKETFCFAYLSMSMQEKYKIEYINSLKKIYPNIVMYPIKSTKNFGKDFIDSKCDAFLFGWKASYYDGYEYLTMFEDKKINFSGMYYKSLSEKITQSQNITNLNKRSLAYQTIVNEIGSSCVIRPLITVPVKKVYIRKKIIATGIGLVPTHLYYFGNVTRQRL